MESSDDSCDQDTKNLKNELTEYGLDEDNLSKEEMIDLLRALKYSKSTVQEDELLRQKVEDADCNSSPKVAMKRRYLNVRDRRLPWSILPPTISPAEKARTLAVYIKLMSINKFWQARQSVNLAAWPPPIQILESTHVQPLRSTRSGRSVPVYADFDEDSSDYDMVIKTKKRKVSMLVSNLNTGNSKLSLKRKTKDDNIMRSLKEAKLDFEEVKSDSKNDKSDEFSIIIEEVNVGMAREE